MLVYLFDNLDAASLQLGRNCVDLIQHYMTEEKIIRLTQDGTENFTTINQKTISGIINDMTVGEFDLEISETPYGRTAQEIEFSKLVDIMNFIAQQNPQLAMQLLPIYIKASGSAYKNDILQIINNALNPQQGQQPDPQQQAIQQQMIQGQLQGQQLDLQGKALNNQKLQIQNQGAALDIQEKKDGESMARYLETILNQHQ
jgi:hypothetical protein